MRRNKARATLLGVPSRPMHSYHQLKVWQKAHALALHVHSDAKALRRRDRSGLASQINRAARSIPTNIVEGCLRPSDRDFARFLHTSIASSAELEYHLEFAVDARLMPRNEFVERQREIIEVRRMLMGLCKRVSQSNAASPRITPATVASKSKKKKSDSLQSDSS